MGSSCLLTPFVIGYKRVPDPPASTIPFILVFFSFFSGITFIAITIAITIAVTVAITVAITIAITTITLFDKWCISKNDSHILKLFLITKFLNERERCFIEHPNTHHVCGKIGYTVDNCGIGNNLSRCGVKNNVIVVFPQIVAQFIKFLA